VDGQHSRVPIYDAERGPEHIVGVLYARDLMRWMRYRLSRTITGRIVTRETNLRIRHIMREVLVVPEAKTLPDLLTEFKERKRHLAVVVDEFGSTAGVITVEDVLAQLVGPIEESQAREPVALLGSSTMELDASINIRDLELDYQIILPRDGGFETLAGFVLAQLQRIPKVGDSFQYEGRRYTVTAIDGLRVDRVRIDSEQPVSQAQPQSAAPATS
ncbi:MAG: transporter associated domain-containing protein, partial [Candidatus Korobacteraceae bacterium]